MALRQNGSHIFPKSRIRSFKMSEEMSAKIDELFEVLKVLDYEVEFHNTDSEDGNYPNIEYTFFNDSDEILFEIEFDRWGRTFNDFWFRKYDGNNNIDYLGSIRATCKHDWDFEKSDWSEVMIAIDESIKYVKEKYRI